VDIRRVIPRAAESLATAADAAIAASRTTVDPDVWLDARIP
jgi:hypothetical protein